MMLLGKAEWPGHGTQRIGKWKDVSSEAGLPENRLSGAIQEGVSDERGSDASSNGYLLCNSFTNPCTAEASWGTCCPLRVRPGH